MGRARIFTTIAALFLFAGLLAAALWDLGQPPRYHGPWGPITSEADSLRP